MPPGELLTVTFTENSPKRITNFHEFSLKITHFSYHRREANDNNISTHFVVNIQKE